MVVRMRALLSCVFYALCGVVLKDEAEAGPAECGSCKNLRLSNTLSNTTIGYPPVHLDLFFSVMYHSN